MPLVVPNAAEIELLERMLSSSVQISLYTNDVTPSETTVYGDFIQAASSPGSHTVSGGTWEIETVAGTTSASNDPKSFSFATSASVYGYYVHDGGDGLLWCERFSGAPFTIPASGGEINVTPKIELS